MEKQTECPPEDQEKLISWRKSWPVFMALLMLSFNVEMVLMNILRFRYGITGWDLFYISAILGNIELSIWIWLIGKIGVFIKQNPGFRLFYSDIKSRGVDKLFRKSLKAIADKLDPENIEYLQRMRDIKVGYFGMFLFGVCIGAWVFGIIIFRTTRWYAGLIMMMLGNSVKLGLFAAGYSSLGWIFLPVLLLTFIYKIRQVLR